MDASELSVERLKAAGRRIKRSRDELDRAVANAKRVAVDAHQRGTSKTEITRSLGITRPTLDAWLAHE